MSTIFNELPWHDAVILSIVIDRRHPGRVDEVVVEIRWPNDQEDRMRFLECYALEAQLNFGVVAPETVRVATELNDGEVLQRIRAQWSQLGADTSKLKCFSIETNSTASRINIYAQDWSKEVASESRSK